MSGHTPWPVIRDARFRSTPEDAARYDARQQQIRESCRVYWGSHGCNLPRGHEGAHDCQCCECGDAHPDAGDGVLCVSTAPYYGEGTRFYGEDAEAHDRNCIWAGLAQGAGSDSCVYAQWPL